jgi:hypothetical protein
VTKLKKLEAEGADSVNVESIIRFKFLVDPSNPATQYSKKFFIFKDGSPEDYIRWMLLTKLKGHALSLFEYHLLKRCGG